MALITDFNGNKVDYSLVYPKKENDDQYKIVRETYVRSTRKTTIETLESGFVGFLSACNACVKYN
jgi:hypothetical protein